MLRYASLSRLSAGLRQTLTLSQLQATQRRGSSHFILALSKLLTLLAQCPQTWLTSWGSAGHMSLIQACSTETYLTLSNLEFPKLI